MKIKYFFVLVGIFLLNFAFNNCSGNKTPSSPVNSNNNQTPILTATFTASPSVSAMLTFTQTVFISTPTPDIYEEDDIPTAGKNINNGAIQR